MNVLHTTPRNNKAFTLLELIVSMAIIGVLTSFIIVGIPKIKERSNRVKCMNNLRQIGVAIGLYLDENNYLLPTGLSGATDNPNFTTASMRLLNKWLPNQGALFVCPSDRNVTVQKNVASLVRGNNSYCYVGRYYETINAKRFPGGYPLMVDKGIPITQYAYAIQLQTIGAGKWGTNPNFPSNHGTEGGHILSFDGRVRFYDTFPNCYVGTTYFYNQGEADPNTNNDVSISSYCWQSTLCTP